MSLILIDTETTGLLKALGSDIKYQPKMIELYALKVNKKGKILGDWHSLFNPEIPLPEIITKITNIEQSMVDSAPLFKSKRKSLKKFFKGSKVLIAHNLTFDKTIINLELERLNKDPKKFPWPKTDFCTIEQSMHIEGRRLKLQRLYEIATGEPEIKDAHRAESDVLAMFECYKWLMDKG